MGHIHEISRKSRGERPGRVGVVAVVDKAAWAQAQAGAPGKHGGRAAGHHPPSRVSQCQGVCWASVRVRRSSRRSVAAPWQLHAVPHDKELLKLRQFMCAASPARD